MSRRPPDREKLWADLVARRLLADLVAGKRGSIGGDAIEEACDLAMRKIIGRVDRGKLVEHATRRVVQLASELEPSTQKRRSPGRGTGV